MGHSEHYARVRDRLVAEAADLSDEEAAATVPATPAWSVRDVYAHLAGACADVLEGRLEGVTTDPWTEAQVAARRGRTLAEITEEWQSLAPRIDELVDALGEHMDPRFFIDAWTHEQDLRSLWGRPGGIDDPLVEEFAPAIVKGICVRTRRAGLAPVEVRAGDAVNRSADDPEVLLEVEPYELLRGVLGRRSRRQLRSWTWTAPPGTDLDAHVDALLVFGIADADLDDAR